MVSCPLVESSTQTELEDEKVGDPSDRLESAAQRDLFTTFVCIMRGGCMVPRLQTSVLAE